MTAPAAIIGLDKTRKLFPANSNMESDLAGKEVPNSSIPSCESCRKRKLKCPRQLPSCLNCEKFGVACVYDHDRKRPGLKVGAVESLSRRLEIIENALPISLERRQATLPCSPIESDTNEKEGADSQQQSLKPVVGVLSSLVKEIHSLSSAISSLQQYSQASSPEARSFKRKRTENVSDAADTASHGSCGPKTATLETLDYLDDSYANDMFDCYFLFIHPWISILHEPSFRNHYQAQSRKERSRPIIHAIVIATQRLMGKNEVPPSSYLQDEQVVRARQLVLHTAADNISLENLQALLILTYIELADGNSDRVCSLLGVIARQIEYLQLSQEDTIQRDNEGIFRSPGNALASTEWIEEEEKRRAFWNAFLLDRCYASITGCKPCFSGATINRRLPVCASFWLTNQPQTTPYLQISDSSSPSLHYSMDSKPSPARAELTKGIAVNSYEASTPLSGMGSLAFYLESVETMSMVMIHVLHQSLDFSSRDEVSRWLARIKEIDLSLMRWKMRLPQQWADSGVSRSIVRGVMDSAMTVANSTHNTCLILLHEQIAYPSAELDWIRLPRLSSAEVCLGAAIEVCKIIRKFLEQSNIRFPLPPQLGVCAFVSANTLLRHWRYFAAPLAQEFWSLVYCLDDMASRWQTPTEMPQEKQSTSLFSRFAECLRDKHSRCEFDPSYQVGKAMPLQEYTPEASGSYTRHFISPDELPAFVKKRSQLSFVVSSNVASMPSIRDNSLVEVLRTPNHQERGNLDHRPNIPWNAVPAYVEPLNESLIEEDLLGIPGVFTFQDFTGMDRIVNFDEMMPEWYF
ncbi:fungal-specific transcription factor domain-containing protein, partial [Cadophora sp. MPI-SDFR-AT-0126]